MSLSAATLDTPAGPLTLLAGDDGLLAGGFTADAESLRSRLGPARRSPEVRFVRDLGAVGRVVGRYFDGELDALDELPVAPAGTDHQQRVWKALRAVPAGTTISYAALAARAGSATAFRAAGTACGRNLVAPVIPCHRAVRSDGGLGGYAYGLAVKRWLLDHERRHAEVDVYRVRS